MKFFQLGLNGPDIEWAIYIRDKFDVNQKVISAHKPSGDHHNFKIDDDKVSLQVDVHFPDAGASVFFFDSRFNLVRYYYIEALKTPVEIQKFFHKIVRRKNISLPEFLTQTIEIYLKNQDAKLLVTKREPDFSLEKILVSAKNP